MDYSLIEGFSLGWVIMWIFFGEDNFVGVFVVFCMKVMEMKIFLMRVRNLIVVMSEY